MRCKLTGIGCAAIFFHPLSIPPLSTPLLSGRLRQPQCKTARGA